MEREVRRMTLARIGRFRVERTLGVGSFATVWLARDEDLDGWVAIKLLAENWSFDQDARRRFIEEARALRRLDDDRIVRVYEIGRLPDDRPYMVMELADRGTLEDRIRLRAQLDQPFSVGDAVDLSIEIAECLIAVHDRRLVHRDVKPSNVLFRSVPPERQEALRRDGHPVPEERMLLADFGIVRRLEGALGHTMVGGSPQYMAPEQGDPNRARLVDYRSDLYSAAVILYELLSGRVPLRLEGEDGTNRTDGPSGGPEHIQRLRPDVPASLARVIHRGLALDPDRRFSSAWEWRDAIRTASAGEETEGVVTTLPSARPTSPRATSRATATLPKATERGTAVLVPDVSGRSERAPVPRPDLGQGDGRAPERQAMAAPGGVGLRLRFASVSVVLAGLLMAAGVLLPWSNERWGAAFTESSVASFGAGLLVLAGVRLWRTRRRWLAVLWSGLSGIAGLAGASLGLFAILRIARDSGALGAGPPAILLAGVIAAASGYRALIRLRRSARPWTNITGSST